MNMEIILEEQTSNKMRERYFYSYIKPHDRTVLHIFGDPKRITYIGNLDKYNLRQNYIAGVTLPAIKKAVNNTINLSKLYPAIEKEIKDNGIQIKLYRTKPTIIPENKFLIVDINPILYSIDHILNKYKAKKFDYYFKIVEQSTNQYNNVDNIPIIIFDGDNITEDFIELFDKWLKLNEYKLDNTKLSKVIALVKLNRPFYVLLARNYNGTLIFNKQIWNKIKNELIKYMNEKMSINDERKLDELIEKKINEYLESYDIKDPKVKNSIKQIINEYIEKSKLNKVYAYNNIDKVLDNAVKEVANTDITLSTLSREEKKEKIEEIGKSLIDTVKIKPKVQYEFTKIIPIEESTTIETTIADRHKKEFDKLLDIYTRKMLGRLEKGAHPLKIKKVETELVDNNINRLKRYKITVQDEDNQTYQLTINLPTLMSEKYFKLNGKTYILVNQLFLKPITKADHNSARFLSNYATITLSLKNSHLPLVNINEILDHIINKYGEHIVYYEINDDEAYISGLPKLKYRIITFDNGYSIYAYSPIGNDKYIIVDKINPKTKELEFYVYYDANENKIIRVDETGEHVIPYKYREYMINKLQKIISNYDPKDLFAKTLKSIPYIQIHIAGIKLPYIKFMMLYHGLIGSLEKLNIPYKISDSIDSNAFYVVKFKDKFINIYPRDKRQEYIINGLKLTKFNFEKYTLEEFENNKDIRTKIYENDYSPYVLKNFDLIRKNIVDDITEELLKYNNKPTDFDNITIELLDTLFNEEPTSPVDLKSTRIRLSEILGNILYKQISMAKHDYEIRKAVDKTAKLYLDPDYVITQILQGEPTLQYIEPANPIDELNTSTRITPTGIGGVPKNSIQLQHRLIPFEKGKDGKLYSTYFGNISALDTNEYSNVGVNQELTYSPIISSKFGLVGFKYNINSAKFDTLGIGESLAPWVNSIDHDRTIKMAQQMRQTVPLANPDPPLVQSGAEALIPQLTSSRFAIRAEDDGIVEEIKENEYIIVKYNNGTRKAYNIKPRVSKLKRGKQIPLLIEPAVKVGDKISKGQIIAGTTQTKYGLYAYGKNVVVAIMPYNGGTFEDGWVVSEDTIEKFKHKIFEDITLIIPQEATVNYIISDTDIELKEGDLIIEYSFKSNKDAEDYYNNELAEFMDNDESEFETVLKDNVIQIKSPIKGKIRDIKVYINGNVDPKIETLWRKTTKRLTEYINKLSKINGKNDLSSIDNIDTSVFKRGSHKHRSVAFKGAKIVYLIETERFPIESDKFVFRGGNKGTITHIIPKDKKPKALETGLEIDWIHNALSIPGRKNANILLELGVGKVLYFLNKKAKEMAENSKIKTKDIKKLVLDVYNALDQTENREMYNKIKDNIDNIPDDEFRDLCKQIDPLNKPLFIWLVLPFSEMDITWINDAADILNIPLEEKIYMPELNAVTQNPVMVGIAYVTLLEFFPEMMMGYRSEERVSSLTGQSVKGRSNEGIGGARVDELTVTNIINYLGKDSKIVEELYTAHADDKVAKDSTIFHIIQTGQAPDTIPRRSETKTKQLMKILFYGAGLDPQI